MCLNCPKAAKAKLFERYRDGRVHLDSLKDDIGEQNDIAGRHPRAGQVVLVKLHAWYNTVDAKFLRRERRRPRTVASISGKHAIRKTQIRNKRQCRKDQTSIEFHRCVFNQL